MFKIERINEKIKGRECISFDIFDTLIIRSIAKPTDLFLLMQETETYKNICNIKDFKTIRIQAERQANQLIYPVTLTDIYDQIKTIAGINEVDLLMKLEKEMELELCYPNKPIVNLFNHCINEGKRVIITSDMYLPAKILEKMLWKCGISSFEKIYVSSEVKKSKAKGTIFDYIAKDCCIEKRKILHIGDNFKSDYLMTLKSGVHACYIKPTKISEYKKMEAADCKNLIYGSTNAITEMLHQDKNIPYNLGLRSFGPLVTGFSQWLFFELKNDNIDKVYFLSRDGLIIKKIFDEIENFSVNSDYLFASRRSWTVPLIWKHPELDDILSRISMSPRISVSTFLTRVGLNAEKYTEIIEAVGLPYNELFVKDDLFSDEKFINLYDRIKLEVIDNSRKEYFALSEYVKKNISPGKIALVDIGYNGTMQYAIEEILKDVFNNISVHGYYVALNPKAMLLTKNKITAKGFLYEPGKNEEQCNITSSYIALFETVFLAQHGSVEKFTIINENSEPVFYNYEYDNDSGRTTDEKNIIIQYQKGALEFTKYWLGNPYLGSIKIDSQIAVINMNLMGRKPNQEVLNTFGDFRVFDTNITTMAYPKKILYYLVKPKLLKQDFMDSVWKIGFLGRLLGVNFPCEYFYERLKKMHHKMN